MTQITRRSVLGAAVFTAVVPVVASHDRAVAADADIDLAGWALLGVGDEFTDPAHSSAQWHRGCGIPTREAGFSKTRMCPSPMASFT